MNTTDIIRFVFWACFRQHPVEAIFVFFVAPLVLAFFIFMQINAHFDYVEEIEGKQVFSEGCEDMGLHAMFPSPDVGPWHCIELVTP